MYMQSGDSSIERAVTTLTCSAVARCDLDIQVKEDDVGVEMHAEC
jgi:hypothetical protein